jgi:ketosteroid isomerase-like protein
MTEGLHASIARSLWRLTSESDSESVRALLSPDIVWRTYGTGMLSGELHGPDAVVDLLARTGELTDDLTSDLIDVFASKRGAVLYYRVRALRSLQSLDTEVLLVLRIEGGIVTSVLALPLDSGDAGHFWRNN